MRLGKPLAILVLLVGLLGSMPSVSYAQDYSFSLDQNVVDVWINPDGSVKLEYWLTFTCDPGAHPIDVVDLGLPTSEYSISDIRADVDGESIDRIDDDYQGRGSYGVAVWLGSGTIDPGETGTVHIVVERVGGMIYEDDADPEYASTEFSPVWFGSDFTHGTTDLVVSFHLPEGVQPEEPRWHRSPSGWPQAEPDRDLDAQGRVRYTWRNPTAAPDRQYTFGASYPRQYVDDLAIQEGPSQLELIFGSIVGAISTAASCCCNPVVLVIVGFLGFMGFSIWSNRRRKMRYLPPSMKVEGVGVKRGLTAVEAAILLETPLNKVLTMILFSLLKKGAVTVLAEKPLKIETNEPLPEGLREYEKEFIGAIKKDKSLSESRLRKMTVGLVKSVNTKMKGFSRKETVAYYKDIVRRAWNQVDSAGTSEVAGQEFDKYLEWTMLDDDFEDRTRQTFSRGPVYVPMWWGFYRPWGHTAPRPSASVGGGRASSSGPAPSMGRVQMPTLPGSAFAASMIGGLQNTTSRIVDNLAGFTGGVTQVTNPPPVSSSSGGSRSGGGCACACACAGCACACAGGGR